MATSCSSRPRTASLASERGFTLIDILAVVAVLGIVSAMALPMTQSSLSAYRLRGDAQQVNNLVSLAKMRAASRFSRSRVYVDRVNNTYQLQIYDRTTATWVGEGSANRLSTGIRFGFGSLDTAPPNTQNAIGMSPACTTDDGAGTVANTSCIAFNSRGVPVTIAGTTATPTGNNAFYLTNGDAVFATTVTATPLVRSWWSPAGTSAWVRQ